MKKQELINLAKQKGLKYVSDYSKRDLLKIINNFDEERNAKEKETTQDYSRAELFIIAKEKGIKYYYRYIKYDLAEKLNIKLPRPKRNQPNGKPCRKARTVEVTNPNGIITTYPSINQAAKTLGRRPMELYTMEETKIN